MPEEALPFMGAFGGQSSSEIGGTPPPAAGSAVAFANNLRQALHNARKTLASDPGLGGRYLASGEGSLVLCPEGNLWLDVDAF